MKVLALATVLALRGACGGSSGSGDSGGSDGEATALLQDADLEQAGFAVSAKSESNAICRWGNRGVPS